MANSTSPTTTDIGGHPTTWLSRVDDQPSRPLLALTASQQQVVEAKEKGRLLKFFSQPQALVLAAQLMDRAKMRLNHATPYPAEMQNQIAADLLRFPGLTDLEVWNALSMGLNGDFQQVKTDSMLVFSSVNLVRWLKAYIEAVKRPVMLLYQRQLQQLETKPELSLAEQNRLLLEGLLAHFQKMKSELAYALPDYGNAYYGFPEESGIELASLEEKKAIYQQELERERQAPAGSYKDHQAKQDWMQLVEANLARAQDDPFEFRVKAHCRRRALNHYLRRLIEQGIELSEVMAGVRM